MHQRRVDFAEFDAAPTDFHLIVSPALEVQALGFQSHQIAASVSATPAQRRHRSVFLSVFLRIEIAGQTHTSDHQFTDPAEFHRHPGLIDDDQIPTRKRQSDTDRAHSVESGPAGHHGGFRRPVGVPHLTTVHREALGQLGRAGLPAEDQQPHRFQCLGRPQRGKGRNRRHHGDIACDQPGAEIHTATHQGARRWYQAGAMTPR